MAARTRARGPFDYWPGFVDVLSTLLLVITFMLSIFMLGQYFLGQQLNNRDATIESLRERIADLANQLGLAKKSEADTQTELQKLRATLAETEARAAEAAELPAQMVADPELVADPRRREVHPRRKAARRDRHERLEDARELEDGLVVEGDGVHVGRGDPGLGEHVLDRAAREARVVLHAAEALLLRGGDDPSVAHEARGGVVVPGGDPEDVHGADLRRAGR